MPPDTAVRKRSNTPVEGLGRHLIGASGSLAQAYAGSRPAVAPHGNSAVIAKQIASMITEPQRQACMPPVCVRRYRLSQSYTGVSSPHCSVPH
jgi:hypothetical protein